MSASSPTPAELYLDLLKRVLTRDLMGETYQAFEVPRGSAKGWLFSGLEKSLSKRGLRLVRRIPIGLEHAPNGGRWPLEAETMIGLKRLGNIQDCVTDVIRRNVPGDLIETGVWRGGATIFMRAVLKAYGDTTRIVWAADSFRGLPQPNEARFPADRGDRLWTWPQLAVSAEQVRANFARYGLLDEQVRFLEGWFRDTLSRAPIERLAVLRLDGDLYESTMDSLTVLYHKVSPGGYVIVDDYGGMPSCKAAVDDFRMERGIEQELHKIDWTGVFWRVTDTSSRRSTSQGKAV